MSTGENTPAHAPTINPVHAPLTVYSARLTVCIARPFSLYPWYAPNAVPATALVQNVKMYARPAAIVFSRCRVVHLIISDRCHQF